MQMSPEEESSWQAQPADPCPCQPAVPAAARGTPDKPAGKRRLQAVEKPQQQGSQSQAQVLAQAKAWPCAPVWAEGFPSKPGLSKSEGSRLGWAEL